MNLTPSLFAPAEFPDLPHIRGVSAATGSRGFYADRGPPRDDVFLFRFDPNTVCAGVFTQSTTASADVAWCREALKEGQGAARALVVNSGNSNAFTGPKGEIKNAATLSAIQAALGVPKSECFLAATGVIGEPLEDPNYVGSIVPDLAACLDVPDWQACARAFMTTDTYPKGAGGTCQVEGVPVQLAGIAKGSGMIAPNMATMLAYVFTDVAISAPLLQELLAELTERTFNAITVDGDTSTSDTLMVFATGQAGHPPLRQRSDPRFVAFAEALEAVLHDLAVQIVKDGEGASKFIKIDVEGAPSQSAAKKMAAAIANSPLVKTALAASDANWGRVVMAIGNSGVSLNQADLSIWFGDTQVAESGARAPKYDEEKASAECQKTHISLRVKVGAGTGQFTMYTCDLTHAYIDINGAYRT